MNLILFSLLVAGVSAFVIIKMLKKEIPLIVEVHKEKWKAEQHNEKQIKKHIENENIEIEKISKERKKEAFEESRKKRASQMYKENIQKGKDYEKKISNYFLDKGYKVKEHGLIHGKKDKGIDIIVMKNKEITLIQCKNWKADSKKKINHVMIKEFLGNCATFIEKNEDKAKGYKIKKLYVIANDVLEINAKKYIEENREIVEYKIIPFAKTSNLENRIS